MSWSSYVNENLYFARLQLDSSSSEPFRPRQIAAETAAVLFLERAYYGFLNELAHKRKIKETVNNLEDLERHLELESAEVRALKALKSDNGWLEYLLKLVALSRQPRAELSQQGELGLIAVSSGEGASLNLCQLHALMKQTIEELRETSTEW
ncbi:DUF6586 family protein [Hahella ganghwensis]|uniref:DUF6586 family protein n=1 Tax=Hahella ganghwensis TaxID=286420 RepID=UPI00036E9078|nr:DUF6586 family protein [Hahella ganghwensis]